MARVFLQKLLTSERKLLNRGHSGEVQSILDQPNSQADNTTNILRENSNLSIKTGQPQKAIDCLDRIPDKDDAGFVSFDDEMTQADFEYLELQTREATEEEFQIDEMEILKPRPLLSLNRTAVILTPKKTEDSDYLYKPGGVPITVRNTKGQEYKYLAEKIKTDNSESSPSEEYTADENSTEPSLIDNTTIIPLCSVIPTVSSIETGIDSPIVQEKSISILPFLGDTPPQDVDANFGLETEMYTDMYEGIFDRSELSDLTDDNESLWIDHLIEPVIDLTYDLFAIDAQDDFQIETDVSDYGEVQVSDDELFDQIDHELWDDLEEAKQELEEAEKLRTEDTNIITRLRRAKQIAVDVIIQCEWTEKNIDFLTQVFFENGWGATRSALIREINLGATPEELQVAHELRHIWKCCDRYWITFSTLNTFSQVTQAIYRHMSWLQALKIIRVFNGIPCIEEIEVFLDDEFEYWYQHPILRRTHPAFIKYLCYYRTSELDSNLHAAEPRNFGLSSAYDDLNSTELINPNSDYMEKLKALGIDLTSRLMPQRACPATINPDVFSPKEIPNTISEDER